MQPYTGEIFHEWCGGRSPKASGDLAANLVLHADGRVSRCCCEIARFESGSATRTLVQVPFDVERWRAVAAESFRMGCRSRGRMIRRSGCLRGVRRWRRQPLQVAVARLVGFRWPEQEPDELMSWRMPTGSCVCRRWRVSSRRRNGCARLLAASFGDDVVTDQAG